jgi:ABC-2 type transport system permease protein
MRESSLLLYQICSINPFTYAVELIRFALYGRVEPEAVGWTLLTLAIALALAIRGYSPAKGMMQRRAGAGGD